MKIKAIFSAKLCVMIGLMSEEFDKAYKELTTLNEAYKVQQVQPEFEIQNGTLISFNNIYHKTAIKIPDGVTSIKDNVFFCCDELVSIEIPSSVTDIGHDVFAGCSSLENIVIPDGITSISSGVFGGCSSLVNISIPENIISIGEDAFNGCYSLKSLEIPASVTSIGDRAFADCTCTIIWNNYNENFGKGWRSWFKGKIIYKLPKNLKISKDDFSVRSAVYFNRDNIKKLCKEAKLNLKQLIIYLIYALILEDKVKAQTIKTFILNNYQGDEADLAELAKSILADDSIMDKLTEIKNRLA